MWASTPANKPRRRFARWWWLTSLMPLCWVLSAIFHGGLLTWLAWFGPGQVIAPHAQRFESKAGSERIRAVIGQVRERQADRLKERVRELEQIQTQLAKIQTHTMTEYRTFAEQFAKDAPDKAVQAQADAAHMQSEVLTAQSAAVQAVAKASQSHDTNDYTSADAAQKQVQEAQTRLDQLQDLALQTVALGGSGLAPAVQAQTDANTLQNKADMAQVNAAQAREAAQDAYHDARKKQSSIEKIETLLQRDIATVATVKANLEHAAMQAAEVRATANEAQTLATQANSDAEMPGLDSKQRKSALSKLSAAQSKAKSFTSKATLAEITANKIKSAVAQAEAKVEQTKSKLDQAKTAVAEAAGKVETAEKMMVEAQNQARQVQTEASQAQAKAQQTLASARQGDATSGQPADIAMPPAAGPVVAGDVNEMNLEQLYQTAVATESAMTETYRAIRAMELSIIRQIPIQQAFKLTDVAKTLRPDLKGQLSGAVTSGDGVPGARQAAQTAATEINSMVSLGESMLTLACGKANAAEQGATITMASYSVRASQAQTMELLAAEDPNAQAKDLSGAMRAGLSGGGAGMGAGGTGAGGGGTGGTGAGAGPAGSGTGAGRGSAGFGAAVGLGSGYREVVPFHPPKISREAATKALPTRKISSGGLPGEWLFVDSWYIVGPWDNRGRVNIEKKFPPETVIDFDATYVGKDGQPIRWEFVQTPTPRITPTFPHFNAFPGWEKHGDFWERRALDYIIYYAYTTLYFEREQDLWIAIGSDDFSKIWIDDQLVWASGKEHKPWSIDEGYRKVHFHKGLNRILYRVENGQHATDFSLVICLKPDA